MDCRRQKPATGGKSLLDSWFLEISFGPLHEAKHKDDGIDFADVALPRIVHTVSIARLTNMAPGSEETQSLH